MAFDDQTRRRLFKTVTACRNLLTEDFDDQLRGRFGIYADEGRVLEIDRLPGLDDAGREVAGLLRERIDHLAAGKGRQALGEAVHRLRREQAFTVLNRFAAVRMAEERDLISQSVGAGFQSRGFRIFEQAAGGTALGELYDRYRVYLDCLFDELSLDLGVLFDRSDAMGLLFPGEQALRALFDELNHPDIAPLWAEDETIGWIYQYYNDPEERKRMRKESAAPRNSRELAVRNQFFTPRYVVEFLTDNTLGRIWYEMTRGRTRLVEQCRYLVRRPIEIFLKPVDEHLFNGCRDWVREVRSGNFVAAVEDATWDEMASVALAIDGYEIAGVLGLRDVHDHVRPRWELAENEGRVDDATLLDQWLLLFSVQRGVLREAFQERDTALQEPVRAVWRAWVRAAKAEADAKSGDGLSQEELLRKPVFIPPRTLKDPREIRLLDPACGSMHFGLYAFDLYETIYAEAWDAGHVPKEDFGARYRAVLHHESVRPSGRETAVSNYGGEPISLSEAEILIAARPDSGDGVEAGLPYLVKAGTSFRVAEALRVPFAAFDYRAGLAKGTFTAEQGERFLRETGAFDFEEDPAVSDQEARERFLREVPRLIIEHNIHGVDIDPRAVQIAALSLWLRAQKAWKDQGVRAAERPQVRRSNIVCAEPMPGSAEMLEEFVATLDPPLLGSMVKNVFEKMQLAGEAGSLLKIEEEIRTAIETARKEWLNQQDDLLTRKGRSQEDFFETAEQQVIDALRAHAEQADADSYQRRLFADDAARGFAFIDLCRKRYDAVVMNPPFGLPTESVEKYAKERFEKTWQDIYASFFERTLSLTRSHSGLVGAITPKSFYHAKGFRGLRSLLKETGNLAYSIDIGGGVLDAAVEVCFSILESRPTREDAVALFCNLVSCEKAFLAERVFNFTHGIANSALPTETVPVLVGKDAGLPNEMLPYRFPDDLLLLLRSSESFEAAAGSSVVGITTFDNERFIRLRWEAAGSSHRDKEWLPVAMGGGWDPFYSEFNLVVKWKSAAAEMRANELRRYDTTARTMQSQKFWHRPGLTFSKISTLGFSTQPFPANSIFTSVGFCIFYSQFDHWTWLGYFNSKPVCCLMSLFSADRHWHSNSVAFLPVPDSIPSEVGDLAKKAYTLVVQQLGQSSETSPEFIHCEIGIDVEQASTEYRKLTSDLERQIAQSFGLSEATLDFLGANAIYAERSFTAPDIDIAIRRLSYCIGTAFGRWDIRFATGERQPPELPDPFDPLPVCPPGMLQNAEGLPAEPKDVPADYPLRITWPGILVDDENHPEDVVGRVRHSLRVIWGDRADDIEAEACEILGVKAKPKENLDALRVYFRDPNRFFKEHLARYSKSRRKAPIYWPLSTESGSYTLWIYYHRLDSQTLYTCVSDFIDPKREAVGRTAEDLARRIGAGGSSEERQRLEDLTAFQAELKTLRDRLLEVAALPYRPNLNDGVQITAAPLWQCFRHSPWQKVLKDTWKELEKGKYDWAHLALPIWPARVVAQCANDRSLAIAHGLEDLLWVPDVSGKKKDQLRPLKAPEDEIKELVKAGHDKKDVERAANDVAVAETLGIRGNLWVEQPEGAWRRRLSPKEEIEGEVSRRKGL